MFGNNGALSTSTASAGLNQRCNPSAIPKLFLGVRSTREVSCSACANVSADVIWHKMVGDFSWSLSLRCCLCNSSWFICTECNLRQIPKFTDFGKAKRHCNAYHSTAIVTRVQQTSYSAEILHDDIIGDFEFSEQENSYASTGHRAIIISEQHNKFSSTVESSVSTMVNDTSSYDMSNLLGSATSTYYFSAELCLGKFSGAKRLVMNSQFGCASSLHNISSTDIDRQLLLSEFIYSLKKKSTKQAS